ncbi:helix-turn-helix domain-containing protein [Verticiella sediminum]|uniref:Helix-turn-helix domain-containing protein n=1 Tax=Verticiella sediminum TaxID=1247510 RepID=A0A556AF85_9BURK|nr:helix-turn-helix domain-containing protein [Verticiella sediminum]TSH91547.1 helix-turn-helix domain-containing protein [Verticiella sediminum]
MTVSRRARDLLQAGASLPAGDLAAQTDGRSAARLMAVLRVVAASQEHGLRTSEVSAELGLSYTTARRILAGLLAEGAVELSEDGRRFRIGEEITLLGLARAGPFALGSCALPHMQYLVRTFGETVYLTVCSRWDSVCIHREIGTSERKVLSISRGSRRPLGVAVGSIAMLGAMTSARSEAIVAANADRYPRYGIAADRVRHRVACARIQGHAYADPGLRQGTRSVGVAIRDPGGEPMASLSIVAIASRLDDGVRARMANDLGAVATATAQEMAARAAGR